MNKHQRTDNSPTEPAAPCSNCHSPTFWRSAYGGSLRCAVCDEWPSMAMVGSRWTLYGGPGGVLEWVPCLRRGERAADRQEASQAVERADDDGFRVEELDDEEGSWLVISKVRTKGGTP
jgi:hypothetical protein